MPTLGHIVQLSATCGDAYIGTRYSSMATWLHGSMAPWLYAKPKYAPELAIKIVNARRRCWCFFNRGVLFKPTHVARCKHMRCGTYSDTLSACVSASLWQSMSLFSAASVAARVSTIRTDRCALCVWLMDAVSPSASFCCIFSLILTWVSQFQFQFEFELSWIFDQLPLCSASLRLCLWRA